MLLYHLLTSQMHLIIYLFFTNMIVKAKSIIVFHYLAKIFKLLFLFLALFFFAKSIQGGVAHFLGFLSMSTWPFSRQKFSDWKEGSMDSKFQSFSYFEIVFTNYLRRINSAKDLNFLHHAFTGVSHIFLLLLFKLV